MQIPDGKLIPLQIQGSDFIEIKKCRLYEYSDGMCFLIYLACVSPPDKSRQFLSSSTT